MRTPEHRPFQPGENPEVEMNQKPPGPKLTSSFEAEVRLAAHELERRRGEGMNAAILENRMALIREEDLNRPEHAHRKPVSFIEVDGTDYVICEG